MNANEPAVCIAAAARMAVLAAAPSRAQSLVLGGGTLSANTLLSAHEFSVHYASGRYWTVLRSDSCGAGRIRLYSSPDGSTWSEATGSTAFSFCAQSDEWTARFLGNVVVAPSLTTPLICALLQQGRAQQRRHRHLAEAARRDGRGGGGNGRQLNAAIVNGKPVLWGADPWTRLRR